MLMMTSSHLNFRALIITLFAFVSLGLSAQTTVKGVVLEPSGDPAIGATVMEKGASTGTSTDFDGNFEIKVKSPNATLVVSYVGLETQEVKLNGRTNVTVNMKESGINLDEVVVVGYGVMKKSDVAGASVTMGEDKIKGSIITNIDQSLQGRATGVQALTTSGAPGSSSSIRVRGQSSINANAEPLYVVDGVIYQSGGGSGSDFGLGDALGNGKTSTVSPLSTINPSDIVSMEILKDASATAIYGAQGSNGVVLITTKRGKAGEARFTYDGMVALHHQNKRLDMMNLREYSEYYNDFVNNGFAKYNDWYADPSLLGVGTNWQDAAFRTALQHQHQVSAQGGSDAVQYFFSGSYMDQEGTIIGSDFRRFSFRLNLDAQLKKWLKLGVNSTYTDTDESLKLADGTQGIINYTLTSLPDIPIYDIDGNYATVVREGYTNPNPIALAMLNKIKLRRHKLAGSFFFDVTPIKGLLWHTEFGYDISSSKGDRFEPTVQLGNWVRDTNLSTIQKNSSWFWQVKNYVTYNGDWDRLSYTAMVGQECWESHYDYNYIEGRGLPSNDVENPSLADKTSYSIRAGFGSSAMASFFTRENLNWDDRYLLTYTYRYDGSSNFGPKNRWAGFHSVAAAWRFTNEKFFEPLNTIFSNSKLRIGWGQTGNANIGGYGWGTALSAMPTGLGTGYRPLNIPNPAIKWETQEQWNAGLDLGFFNNRLMLTFDAYIKTSKDMLMSMQLPSYLGTQGNISSALQAPKGNFGEIENKGIEIEVTGRPFVGDFEWESSIQFSFNKNKLKSLSGVDAGEIVGYGQWSDIVSLSQVGQPLYGFYGYVVEGVYRDLEDIMNSPRSDHYPTDGVFNRTNTVWPGDLKFKDVNGNGYIDEGDRTIIGNPLPDFTFGWTNTFRYKNFDLSIFINGSYGNDVMNYIGKDLTSMKSTWTNQLASVSDRAQLAPIDPNKAYPAGQNWYDDINNVRVVNWKTGTPRAAINDPNENTRISSRYIEDGSYIRLKNISLGYTFKKSVLKKLHLENLRIYANIQNLWTITGYNGYDPEIGANTQDATGLVYGLDNGRYPSPTTYSLGLNLSF